MDGHGPLDMVFPDLGCLNMIPEELIEYTWSPHCWNFSFKRPLIDWEFEIVGGFLKVLESFKGATVNEDYDMRRKQKEALHCQISIPISSFKWPTRHKQVLEEHLENKSFF